MRRLISLVGLCLTHIALNGRPNDRSANENLIAETVRAILPAARTTGPYTVRVTEKDRESLRRASGLSWTTDSLQLYAVDGPDSLAGFAVLDNVRGKDQLITYLLVVSPELAVRGLEILAYRESFGGEIRNSSWRRQFKGKTPEDSLMPGKDISNITGATISARAVTLGVNRILKLLGVLLPQLPRGRGMNLR